MTDPINVSCCHHESQSHSAAAPMTGQSACRVAQRASGRSAIQAASGGELR